MIEYIRTCACGGIGRHARFRILCASVQVQVLSGAPKKRKAFAFRFNYFNFTIYAIFSGIFICSLLFIIGISLINSLPFSDMR